MQVRKYMLRKKLPNHTQKHPVPKKESLSKLRFVTPSL